MKNHNKVLLGAAAAGALLASGCTTTSHSVRASSHEVQCYGVNSCAGKGECGGKHDDGTKYGCNGNNKCAKKGWIKMDAKDCAAKGGSLRPNRA